MSPMVLTPAPRRILIFKPCCIGDVLMATPLAASLASAWPDAEITWAVDDHSRPVLLGNPHLSGLLDASGCFRGALRVRDVLRLVREIRRHGYDAAFIADRSPISAWIVRLAGVPIRVGLDSGGRGWVHMVRVPTSPDDGRPEREIYLGLARMVGIEADPTDGRPVFVPSESDRVAAAELLGVAGSRGQRPFVAIHPGGGENPGMSLLEKRWPSERYGVVAARIVAEGGRVVVLGGPNDSAVGAAVIDGAVGTAVVDGAPAGTGTGPKDAILDLTGRASLGVTAAVIAMCDAYVGNDSGIAHLAAAVGTPVVVVFGPTDAVRYGPAPGAGVAVTPDGVVSDIGSGAAERVSAPLRDLAGSSVIREVMAEAVWSALELALKSALSAHERRQLAEHSE